jgi:hypothetical protein
VLQVPAIPGKPSVPLARFGRQLLGWSVLRAQYAAQARAGDATAVAKLAWLQALYDAVSNTP